MSSAIAKSASDGAAEIEASSVRWVGRCCQKWENENCPIGMISVIATSDVNPTKPPSTVSVGDFLSKEHRPRPEEEILGPKKRSRVGTSETELTEVSVRSVLPPGGS